MPLYTHTLSNGLSITLNVKRTSRKNLILRPVDAQTVSLNIPPSLSLNRLYRWLHEHETLLHQTLSRTPSPLHTAADSKPDWIWYQGIQTALVETAQPGIEWRPETLCRCDEKSSCGNGIEPCQNILGSLPNVKRYPPKLAVDWRTGICGRLCLYP